MNKYILSILVIGAFVVYSWRVQTETKKEIPVVTTQPTSQIKEKKVGLYRDGTYESDIVDAIYGNVQLKVTVRDGFITEIVPLQYPDHHDYSREINPPALASLAQEAIQSQKATVDIYSGATQTSKAFQKSLQSVIEQATL